MKNHNSNTNLFHLLTKAIGFVLLLLFIHPCGHAAINVDSLLLQARNQTDVKAKLKILDKLYWYYSELKPDSALIIANNMLQIASKTTTNDKAWTYYKIGNAYNNMGQYPEAETNLNLAVSLSKATDNKSIPAHCYLILGHIYAWKTKNKEAIQYHKMAQKLFGELKDSKNVAITNNQIAIQFDAMGIYDSAFYYFYRNIENRDTIKFKYAVLFSYQLVAEIYSRLHNYKEAYNSLLEGIEYAEKTNQGYALAELYLCTGNLFITNHINEKSALEYLQEAKKLFQKFNEKLGVLKTELLIGDYYFHSGDDPLALKHYLLVADSMRDERNFLLSTAFHKIGMLYKSQQKYDTALLYFHKGIDEMCKICPEISIHNTLIETGNLYLNIGKPKQARDMFFRAKNIALNAQTSYEQVIADESIAKYFNTINKPDSAIFYYNQALLLARKLTLTGEVYTIAKSLSALYYAKGEYKKSSELLTLGTQMSDSLALAQKSNEQAKLEMRLEIEKLDEARKLENLASQNEIKRQKFIRNYSLGGSVVVILVSFFLFKAYRRKRRDNQLLDAQKIEIEQMARQLHETDYNKLQFFTNISHEIRTPLTLIKAPLEKLLGSTGNSDIHEPIQLAYNNTIKLQQIVNQIMDLRKLDESKLTLHNTSFELIGFITTMVQSFEAYCQQAQCKLRFRSNATLARVSLDSNKLYSIVSNLLSNAFKYNKVGGEVQLLLELGPTQITISVVDTGRGIPEEHLKKLATRYYQVDTSMFIEGTGIGLAYVKELLELMHGTLDIASTLDKGTTATITIPVDEITIEDANPYILEIKPVPEKNGKLETLLNNELETSYSQTILIIEDNVDLRQFIQQQFTTSYQVICAKDGNEGKELAIQHCPDIIISDIMMPGIQGNELCRMLKSDVRTSHIPIILLTAKDARESQVDGYNSGADDYIIKPFDTNLLIQKVTNILKTRDNARKQFSFADVESKAHLGYSDLDHELLNKCVKLVHKNMDNSNFTVEKMSDELGVSRKTLLRKFKALTDKTPSDLIKHTRMTHAAMLLREKKLRVNEVACMVGYDDPDSFSYAFKQFHGIAPSGYC